MYQQNYGQPAFGAYGFNYGPRPQPKYTQPITPELAKMLNQQNDELDIRISNTEKVRNWCTHKEPGTGRLALVDNGDGSVTCRVCGETFHLAYDEDKVVAENVDKVVDYLQTIKAMYVDIPEEFLKAYSQTKSMVEKIKDLMPRAKKNFSTYEVFQNAVYPNYSGVNHFQAANGILSGVNPFMPQQPMMGYGYPYGQVPAQQPGMWAQPPMQQMQMPAAPQINPWDGNVTPAQMQAMPMAPTTIGGIPMTPGYNPLMNTGMPGAMTAPAPTAPVPAAPVAAEGLPVQEPTQTKQMTV